MSNTQRTPAQMAALAALAALEQAYEYYSPQPYVAAIKEPVEYFEYSAAA